MLKDPNPCKCVRRVKHPDKIYALHSASYTCRGILLRSKSSKRARTRNDITRRRLVINQIVFFRVRRPRSAASLPCTKGNENPCTIQPDNIPRDQGRGHACLAYEDKERKQRRRIVLAKPIALSDFYQPHLSHSLSSVPAHGCARAQHTPAYLCVRCVQSKR